MRDVLGWQDPVLERFKIDEDLAASCGWVWWHENILAISDRPSVLNRDDQGRLHCENGPSIAYRDGWTLHHWHGVSVPAYVIEAPSEITVAKIEAEANAEVRRVMIERYGAARYLQDSNAVQLHKDEFGVLYRKDIPGDEPLVMVHVLNSTPEPDGSMTKAEAEAIFSPETQFCYEGMMMTLKSAPDGLRFKDYFLRVAPDLRPLFQDGRRGLSQELTARNAVASTWGLRGEEYAPAIET